MKKKTLVIVAIVVAMLLITSVYLFLYNSNGWKFWRMYQDIDLGMSKQEVMKIFGKGPDFQCNFDGFRVFYFYRSSIIDHYPDLDTIPKQVDKKDDIPIIYASAQLLFTPDDHLIACTVNGESSHIWTREGKLVGSNITLLPDKYFVQNSATLNDEP